MALGRKPIEIVNEGKHQLLTKAEHWDRIYLKEVAKVQNGYAFSSEYFTKSEGIPLIRIRDIDNYTTVDRFIGQYNEDYVVKKGDILIGMDGDFKAARWKGENALLNQRVCRIIPISMDYNEKFLVLCLQPFLDAIHSETSSVTVKHISSKTIEEIPLPLPPKKEQDEIVSKMEELFSELGKVIENLRLAKQQLKTYRQSVLKWAFEGRLTNKHVKERELPRGWNEVKLSDVTEMNPNIPNRDKIDRKMQVQFLPMKLVGEITNKIQLTETRKYEDLLKGSYTSFIDGDVIFAKVTPCMENGKIAVVNNLKNGIGFGSSEFHVIRSSSKVTPKFIFYYLVQDRFRHEAANAMTGAVGLRRVPRQFIESHTIPLPAVDEQNNIVLEIENRLRVADKTEESITQSLQQAEVLKQSILKKAFDGKLTNE